VLLYSGSGLMSLSTLRLRRGICSQLLLI